MWQTITIQSDTEHLKFRITESEKALNNRRFLELLSADNTFITWYNQQLHGCPYDAFFWEHKPLTQNNLDDKYECNLVKSDFLAGVQPDSQTFSSYFKPASKAVSFPNLGGDAQLIAPCPVSDAKVYTHIGKFVRMAPESQLLEFWKTTAREMTSCIGKEPKWLSTSGLGVFWLHVRIDSKPKYYQTKEYKKL